MARVTGNLELDGTTVKLKQGQTNSQSIVAGAPTVPNQQIRLPNETDTLTELITATSGGDASKRIKFNTSSQTTNTILTINTAQTTSQTLTIPNISSTDSILLANATQTLANKTLEDPTLKTATHELGLRVAPGNTASALLTFDLNNVSRNINLGGNFSTLIDNVSLIAAIGGSSVSLPQNGSLLSLVTNTVTIPNTAAATISLASNNTLTLDSSITQLIITGDLTVNGTTTTINSTNLAVSDKNITVNFNGNNAGLSVGDPAGITVEDGIADGTNSRLIWNNTSKRFEAGQTGSEIELTLNTATQTLTNKTFDSTSNVVLKGGNTDGSALTLGTNDAFNTQIEANNSVRLTAHHNPAVAGDVTINGTSAIRVPVGTQAERPSSPSNGMVRYDSTANKFEGFKNGAWAELGSAASGGINYIANPDAEDTTTAGWAAYKDTAATTPVDGTGGSPTVTITNTSTNPVRGTRSFLLSKPASNVQGEGISYDFTIDRADTNKQLTISLDYFVSDTNYASGNVRLFVYDVTNNILIYTGQPDLPAFIGTESAYTHKTSFVSTNSTSYRLILHIAATHTNTFTMTFDNVRVGPDSFVSGTPVTDWQTYTPTFGAGFGTVTSIQFVYRRVGDTMEIQGRAVSGTVSANPATFTLPSPFIASSVTGSAVQLCGESTTVALGTLGTRNSASLYYTPGSATITFSNVGNNNDTRNLLPLNVNVIISSNIEFSLFARIPIAQWAGSTVSIDNSQVEYGYNTTAFNDSDDYNPANTAYGPQGAPFAAVNLTTFRGRRVKFLTPIQPTDVIDLEVSADGGKSWASVNSGALILSAASYPFNRFHYVDGATAATHTHGAGAHLVDAATGEVNVTFGRYFFRSTNGSVLREWSTEVNSNYRWRVSKSRNPLSIGGLTGTKWQMKAPTSDITSDGTVNALTFNNLTIGRTYRVTLFGRARCNDGASDRFVRMSIFHNSALIGVILVDVETATAAENTASTSVIFVATTTTLTFSAVSASATSRWQCDGSSTQTHAILEELPLHSQTSEWT